MNYRSVDEIFAENDRIREELLKTLEGMSDPEASTLVEGEKWTIRQIVEHIAAVDEGSSKVCNMLLKKARNENRLAAGSIKVSDAFARRIVEVEDENLKAPERVAPTGDVSIPESLARMEENRRRLLEIKPLFERFDGDSDKFPHPVFGEISAIEWLVMKGGHEERHTRQIKRLLEKLA